MVIVAAAVIENASGEILIAQRSEPEALRGLWEFPGGKVEDGESPQQALLREIDEELGLAIRVRADLGEFPYHYSNRTIHIRAFVAAALTTAFEIREHLDVRWVDANIVGEFSLVPADGPVFQAYLALKQKG